MLSTISKQALPYARAVRRRALRYARAAGLPGTLTPHDIFQDGSERDRRAFYDAAIARNREGYEARVALMKELNEAPAVSDGLRLPESALREGPHACPAKKPAVAGRGIAEARELFKDYVPGTGNSKRERDPLEGVPRPNRSYESAINRLASHPEILRVVSNYMGMVPLLHRINVLYSPNNEVIESSSQFFHLDPEASS